MPVAYLLNSGPIQARFAEHLRVLGGGLLKFQPNDLLSIEIPDVRNLSDSQLLVLNTFLTKMDDELRRGGKAGLSESVILELDNYVEGLLKLEPSLAAPKVEKESEQLEMF